METGPSSPSHRPHRLPGQYGMNEAIGPRAYVEQQRILNEEIKQQSDADRQSRAEVRLLGLETASSSPSSSMPAPPP